MAMRLTGLISGMDTESMIKELVAVKQTKVDDAKKAQTKLNWKQDIWKSLNSKLKSLQSKYLNNMRFTSSYRKKTTKVSNSNAVNVITGENAVNGVQSMRIEQLAKSGYLTGAELSKKDGGKLTALSKISDITDFSGEGTISISTKKGFKDIKVTGDTTISDVLTQMKEAGVNANFDAKQQRFYITSKDSGIENDFSITAFDANGSKALSALGLEVNLNEDAATLSEYQKYSAYYVAGDKGETLAKMQGFIDDTIASRTKSYLDQYKSLKTSTKDAQKKIDKLNEKYADSPLDSVDSYNAQIKTTNQSIKELKAAMKDMDPEEKKQAETTLKAMQDEVKSLTEKKTDAQTLVTQTENIASYEKQMAYIEQYVNITENTADDGTISYSAQASDKLINEVEERYYDKASYAAGVMASYDEDDKTSTGATKVSGQDAVIYLNNARYTNNDNTFDINGLTFTALSETKAGEDITITTQDDTDGIYNMIKNFLKEYNSIINEMDKLYNGESARGYEPLTNDEKEALSESDIKEYEDKIKDSLLRRDSNLSTIGSALKGIMSGGIQVNGKTMYLSNFGINTMSYFEAADNEKNAYHIDGDADNENTMNNPDKLMSMIANDPDTVVAFFSQLSKDLYGKMDELSKPIKDYRTFGNFFDDKKMKADYEDYTSKIKDLENKLVKYEDKWYAKFSAMETALAKLQSNANAVTSLLGG